MNLRQFLAGVQILQQYYDDPEGYHLDTCHDTIYLYPTDRPLATTHVQQMLDLGWLQPDKFEEEYQYDPATGWQAYT